MADLWFEASRQLLRSLRGPITQQALSRRLGFTANPVREWEAGRRFPTAVQMLELAAAVEVDVRRCLHRFHPPSSAAVGASRLDAQVLAAWLEQLRGSIPVVELAKRSTTLSRFAIGRILRGQSSPRLPDFLRLVHAMTDRADDLVAELTDIDEVPALAPDHRRRRARRELAFDEPWTEAIRMLIENQSYRAMADPPDGWIAEQLGIDRETEARCVGKMLEAGILVRDGHKLSTRESITVWTGADQDRVRSIKRHWNDVARARLEEPGADDLFTYNVMSLSYADYLRAKRILEDAFREIHAVVSASEPEEVAALLQVQLLRWGPSQA